ncbi:type 4a pilus biogenesis protein PilO [Candidatus Zixiibacteriota bacterium]
MSQSNSKIFLIVFVILIVLAGGYAWYEYLYRPILDQIAEKKDEHNQLLITLETAKRQAARRVSLQQEYKELQEQWKVVETLLPKERNMSDFIQQLHRIKGKVDATVERVSPLPSEVMGFYQENPYEVEMYSTYHGLGNFLSHVANLPLIVDVTSLDLIGVPRENHEDEGREHVGPSVLSRLVLTTYSLKEEVELTEENSEQ